MACQLKKRVRVNKNKEQKGYKRKLDLVRPDLVFHHQFSHIKQTYSVWAVEADTQDFKWKDGTPPNLKWLTEGEISQSAISTAMKKVFKLKDKKPLAAPNNTKQRSIASFFVKKE